MVGPRSIGGSAAQDLYPFNDYLKQRSHASLPRDLLLVPCNVIHSRERRQVDVFPAQQFANHCGAEILARGDPEDAAFAVENRDRRDSMNSERVRGCAFILLHERPQVEPLVSEILLNPLHLVVGDAGTRLCRRLPELQLSLEVARLDIPRANAREQHVEDVRLVVPPSARQIAAPGRDFRASCNRECDLARAGIEV